MKTMPYFNIIINAKSPEELARRIADNELRGFEVVKYYEKEREFRELMSTNYIGPDGKCRRQMQSTSHKSHMVVMRRANYEKL